MAAGVAPTRSYGEFVARMSVRTRVRSAVRDLALRGLSLGRRIDGNGWIRFPYYHHVFDDERRGFARQLDYLRRFGDFVSIDEATGMLSSSDPLDGRYFCVGFDDGFKCCAENAVPILAERRIPAVFYVVTGLVGRSFAPDDPVARETFGFLGRSTSLDFMDWDDCRALVAAGMTIGSHAATHPYFDRIDRDTAMMELKQSKEIVERETARPCGHFCVPYGLFDTARDPALAGEAGYVSFATGTRGLNRPGHGAMLLQRDHLLANWGDHQVRYFMSSER